MNWGIKVRLKPKKSMAKAMRAVQFTRAAPSAPSFGPVTAYPAPPSIDPGAGVYVGTGGYVLAPLQTTYLDRAWVALPNGSGAGVPTCADFGSGSHTYRIGSFALESFTDGMYYGWFASPTVTSLSSPCAVGTETLTVMKAGSGTGTVAGNWGTITCGDACTSSSMASNHGVLMQLTAIPAAGSVFAGWREMNDYMRENKMEAVAPQLTPAPAEAAAAAA